MSTDPKIWVAALVTIVVYSYLFKENRFYTAVEHLYVGTAAGYTVVMGYRNLQSLVWQPLVNQGKYWVLFPAILGLLLFAPSFKKSAGWLRRYPMAVIVGLGAALSARSSVTSQFIAQIKASMVSVNSIDNVIMIAGTVLTLSYFIFTIKPNPVIKTAATGGKWFIMVTLGAAFGSGIMARISLLIGRLLLVFKDWIPLIKL